MRQLWITLCFLLLILPLLSSCGSSYKTLVVAPQKIECTGIVSQKCLQVREVSSQNWEYLYGNIKAFDYQEGYEYKIKVKVKELKNPPQDASALVYTLVEVLSKEKTTTIATNKHAKDNTLQQVVYEAIARGRFLHISITEQQVEIYTSPGAADPATEQPITAKDWKEIVQIVDALELEDAAGLIPPTNDRARDAALPAQIKLIYTKGGFDSPTFDHKKPPPALEALVNRVLSMTKGID
ncbi:MAG: DUF4377 domain-containing protein [Aureispira sp.]